MAEVAWSHHISHLVSIILGALHHRFSIFISYYSLFSVWVSACCLSVFSRDFISLFYRGLLVSVRVSPLLPVLPLPIFEASHVLTHIRCFIAPCNCFDLHCLRIVRRISLSSPSLVWSLSVVWTETLRHRRAMQPSSASVFCLMLFPS